MLTFLHLLPHQNNNFTFESNPEMIKRMQPKKRTRYEFKQTKEQFQKWINGK